MPKERTGTKLVIILEPLAAHRLEEDARDGETATETISRIIHTRYNARRDLARRDARSPDGMKIAKNIDEARAAYHREVGDWPEDVDHHRITGRWPKPGEVAKRIRNARPKRVRA
jgi:hypothetical protein